MPNPAPDGDAASQPPTRKSQIPNPKSHMPRLWFWIPAAAGLAADLASKHLIFAALARVPDGRLDVLGPWLVLCMQRNRGGVFGILQGRGPVFIVLSLVALGVVAWMLRQTRPGQRLIPLALGLVVAGALGNLYDRLLFGHVRDFLYVEAIRYPAFNLADASICVAAGLLLLSVFREGKQGEEPPRNAEPRR